MSAAAAAPARRRPRRLGLRTLLALVRNPMEALPRAIFTEPHVRVRAGGVERLYLCDPALIHDALVRHDADLEKSAETRRVLGPALGDGLLTAEGASWRGQRRSMAPVFQPARLDALAPAMLAAARRTRARWLARPPGAQLALGHEMMRTTFDIIVETLLSGAQGLDVARVERAVTDYLAPTGWVLAYTLLQLPEWTPHPGRARARRAAAEIRGGLAARTAERRAALDAGERAAPDLLTLLLQARDPQTGAAFDDAAVVDNLTTFIAAGHETTALGLAWTLHLLDRHPEWAARLRAEIDAVVGDGEVAPEHLERLPLVRQAFAEAMRLYPPAPLISRRALRPFALEGGLQVPRGGVLIVPIHAVHRHAALWDEPERFDPERFAPQAARDRPRHAYMPFGAGARVCIGAAFATLEAVAVLAVLLKAVELTGAGGADPRPIMRVTLRPRPDIAMRARPRAPATPPPAAH